MGKEDKDSGGNLYTMKVMLSTTYKGDENLREFLVSYKLDGIRCLVNKEEAVTRTGKPIRNRALHNRLIELSRPILAKHSAIQYLDGELVHLENDNATWSKSSSIVMSYDNPFDDIRYRIFDFVPTEYKYQNIMFIDRLGILRSVRNMLTDDSILDVVDHIQINNTDSLNNMMKDALRLGYEGLMLNKKYAYYKRGRATPRSQELIKVKNWDYDESKIVELEEYFHNAGEPERGRDGVVRRSKAQANLVGGGILGALVLDNGLRVGTGFSMSQRELYWTKDIIGKVCRYKFLPSVGKAARHPVFVSLGDGE